MSSKLLNRSFLNTFRHRMNIISATLYLHILPFQFSKTPTNPDTYFQAYYDNLFYECGHILYSSDQTILWLSDRLI